jgi:hypothetical protein
MESSDQNYLVANSNKVKDVLTDVWVDSDNALSTSLTKIATTYLDATSTSALQVVDQNLKLAYVSASTAIKVVEGTAPRGGANNWLSNVTINGSSGTSSAFDCTLYGRYAFISYNDTAVGSTNPVYITARHGTTDAYVVIGILQPVLSVSGTIRYGYAKVDLAPFTSVILVNEGATNFTAVYASVFSA